MPLYRLLRTALPIGVAALALLLPAPALAGRLIATGHDADSHCSGQDPTSGECHFVGVAVGWVRGSAPTPSKPALLIDCSSSSYVAIALQRGGAGTGHTTVCPSTNPGFASM